MKTNIYFFIITAFLNVNYALVGQTKKNSPLIPLAIGNYWVYTSSWDLNKLDTIKISKEKIIGNDTAYYYNGKLWMKKNDSIFEYNKFYGNKSCILEFFPSDKEVMYRYLDGDVIRSRVASKIKGAYKVLGKEYFNCYKFFENTGTSFTNIIISKGIGIIEIQNGDRTTSLVSYKIE